MFSLAFLSFHFIILPPGIVSITTVDGGSFVERIEKRDIVENGGGLHTVEISAQRYKSNYSQQSSAEKSHSDQNI